MIYLARAVTILQLVISVLCIVGAMLAKSKSTEQTLMQMAFLIGVPSVLVGLLLLWAVKKLWLVRLAQPVSLLSLSLLLLVINMDLVLPEIDAVMRQYQVFLLLVAYQLNALYTSVDWFATMIVRILTFTVTICSIVMLRKSQGDDINVG